MDYLEKLLRVDFANESGIIYTTTVNDSINLASDLANRKFKVAPYNALLEPDKKKKIHEKWLSKEIQVVIATVAFGMGIGYNINKSIILNKLTLLITDKPDVRFVIHHTIPRSMESLYQESGRAGRNGERADCIVMYNLNDYFKNIANANSVLNEKKTLSVLEYCLDAKRFLFKL